MYSKKDAELNSKLYWDFSRALMDDGWTDDDKEENFTIFSDIFKFANIAPEKCTVLDVGCGTGDFNNYPDKLNLKDYLGIDIFEPAIRKASIKYPDKKFITGDFLKLDLGKFDIIIASGTLTTKLDTDNYAILRRFVRKMWRTSNFAIYFNVLLERYPGDKSRNLFLYNKNRVLEICAKIEIDAKMKIEITDAGCGDETEELHLFIYR